MLVAAAVCPCPPALVPAVSQGGSIRLDGVRAAAENAVRWLTDTRPDVLWAVGAGAQTRAFPAGSGGTLRRHGADVRFGGSPGALPESLTVACYLLGRSSRDARFQAVSAEAGADECYRIGQELASAAERVALLVMADGSARRTRQSPGPFDPRAEPFDAGVVAALASADAEQLREIEPGLAGELWFGGRPGLGVLAGALLTSAPMAVEIAYDGAPLGVGYIVARLAAGGLGS